jgi:hypothetical protein
MQHQCQFCNREFSSKSNLTAHLSKAKYCISKRNNPGEISVIDYKCDFCNKSFTSKHFLLTHSEKCRSKTLHDQNTLLVKRLEDQNIVYETKLQEQKEQKIFYETKLQEQKNLYENKLQERDSVISLFKDQISALQDKLGCVALAGVTKPTNVQTTTTNTNITQILTPFNLNEDDIFSIVQHKLDENSFLNAQKGVAKFCVENILKDEDGKMRMICTDPSRERFKYMDENGVVKEDIQARQFLEKIYPPLHLASEKLYCNIIENCNKSREKIEKGEEKIDPYRVKVREEAADKAWVEIRLIRDEDSNKNFRKELAIRSTV